MLQTFLMCDGKSEDFTESFRHLGMIPLTHLVNITISSRYIIQKWPMFHSDVTNYQRVVRWFSQKPPSIGDFPMIFPRIFPCKTTMIWVYHGIFSTNDGYPMVPNDSCCVFQEGTQIIPMMVGTQWWCPSCLEWLVPILYSSCDNVWY